MTIFLPGKNLHNIFLKNYKIYKIIKIYTIYKNEF